MRAAWALKPRCAHYWWTRHLPTSPTNIAGGCPAQGRWSVKRGTDDHIVASTNRLAAGAYTMTRRKRQRRRRSPGPSEQPEAAPAARGSQFPYDVLWHPAADVERGVVSDAAERAAIQHAREKLEALGPQLGAPHSSAVKGDDGTGLRELRPRAGRSRWRPIYRQVQPRIFVILAMAPEAKIDRRGFDRSVRDARQRLRELEQ